MQPQSPHFRDLRIAAQLKHIQPSISSADFGHFRDLRIAAQLKLLSLAGYFRGWRRFPRSEDRGPIEARSASAETRRHIHFRDLRIAAQLKQLLGNSLIHISRDFRDLRIAAQLKPPGPRRFRGHIWHFRDLRIAAQLKHGMCRSCTAWKG